MLREQLPRVRACVCRSLPSLTVHAEYLRGGVTSRKWLPVTGIWRIANCSLALRSISRAIGRQDCTESAQSSRKSNTEARCSNVSRAESHVPDYIARASIPVGNSTRSPTVCGRTLVSVLRWRSFGEITPLLEVTSRRNSTR